MNEISIHNLSFGYKKNQVLRDITLTIHEGITVFWGANGSGKTTLFKIFTGILPYKSGSIMFNGKDYAINDLRYLISYIPQDFRVYPNLKVIEFLHFIAEVKRGGKAAEYAQDIEETVVLTDIKDFLNEKMKNLSEGMRKRVGIAQALLGNSQIIIADEPTAGLDPEQRNNFNLILQKIPKNRIVILSTHIIEDIKEFYDNIVMVSNGKVTYQGTYTDLLSSLSSQVFEATVEMEALEAFEAENVILSREYDLDKVHVRAASKVKKAASEPVKATLTDAWTYYR